MGRPKRQFSATVAHHVISRGNGKMKVFHDPSDYEAYLRMLHRAKEDFNVRVYHYVLMPNHVHLVLQPRKENGSKFMQALNTAYSKYFCIKYKKIAHVWKNRFKNLIIDNDAYLLACGNYIEMNPVRAGLTKIPGAWPYSSFRSYADGVPNRLVDQNPLYVSFGKNMKVRCEAYKKWIGTTRAS